MFGKLLGNRRGAVGFIGALAIPVLLGVGGFVAEYGNALVVHTDNQRVADAAAFAGAIAYSNSTAATDDLKKTDATSAVNRVASFNGIATSAVTTTVVPSPTNDGNDAVRVNISTTVPLVFARLINRSTSSQAVPVTAYAELKADAQACILALSTAATYNVSLSGGTTISATSCAVSSDYGVDVPCGTYINSNAVAYNSPTAPRQGCSGISGRTVKKSTPDPLNPTGNAPAAAVASLITHAATVASQAAPTVTGGGPIDFAYKQSSTIAQAAADGCVAAFASQTWTVTCAGTNLKFGKITTGGGLSVNFNINSSPSTIYQFSDDILDTSSGITFGPGIYTIAGGISASADNATTFGAGSFQIGGLKDGSCSSAAICVGGGKRLVFGDTSSGVFQVSGPIITSGGSCLMIGAATDHDINSYISASGAVVLGSGNWTVSKYAWFGAGGGGGTTSCPGLGGAYVGVSGTGVTVYVGGVGVPTSGGSCANNSFCVSAGYQQVTLTAGASKLVVVGASSSTAGALFTQGASGVSLSGEFYFPNGPISLSGGASVGNGANQCLTLIGKTVTLSGGTVVASTCITGASTATASLVQ